MNSSQEKSALLDLATNSSKATDTKKALNTKSQPRLIDLILKNGFALYKPYEDFPSDDNIKLTKEYELFVKQTLLDESTIIEALREILKETYKINEENKKKNKKTIDQFSWNNIISIVENFAIEKKQEQRSRNYPISEEINHGYEEFINKFLNDYNEREAHLKRNPYKLSFEEADYMIKKKYEYNTKIGEEMFKIHVMKDVVTGFYKDIEGGNILTIGNNNNNIEIVEEGDWENISATSLFFVNGINNSSEYACLSIRFLTQYFDDAWAEYFSKPKIYLIYNEDMPSIIEDTLRGLIDGRLTIYSKESKKIYDFMYPMQDNNPDKNDGPLFLEDQFLKDEENNRLIFGNRSITKTLKDLFDKNIIKNIACHSNGNPTVMYSLLKSEYKEELNYYGIAPALNDSYYKYNKKKISTKNSKLFINTQDNVILKGVGFALANKVWTAIEFFYFSINEDSIKTREDSDHNLVAGYTWALEMIAKEMIKNENVK